jgi:hypothetical protein
MAAGSAATVRAETSSIALTILGLMRAAMDAAGRGDSQSAEVGTRPRARPGARGASSGWALGIEVAPTKMKLMKTGKGKVAVPEAELPPLTGEQVRKTLERIRR